ncbi:putative HVA22-like protein g isoform X2 [Tasmannia lanceolata]|uniref:putative HVA22-like protein g isoform X2 n=1 Tax=Tasmannia lanceolata TaxID=3420 RepID=UPI004063B036
MMGSFLTRGLVMVLGYAYPAYDCFKTVEKNKPEIEQLLFWCQYWILVAMITVFERVGDTFVSWLPLYSEAKLAFFVYLWYPKTRGTTYVYNTFFRPYVSKHEIEIDRNLLELRTRAGDIAVLYCQKAASYGQTRIFEILHYVASQSPRPRPAQQQRQVGVRQPRPTPPPAQPTTQPPQQPPLGQPATTAMATNQEHEPAKETSLPPPVLPTASHSQPAAPGQAPSQTTNQSSLPSEEEPMQVDAVVVATNGNADPPPPPPQETVMEGTIRVTRGQLRKTRAARNRS